MKNWIRAAALATVAGAACSALGADVVLSQIYGGGGAGSPTFYQFDVVELHNTASVSIGIGGWSVQYASAAGTTWNVFRIPAGTTIPAGGYYLIQVNTAGSTGGGLNPLPTPDKIADASSGSLTMSATAGKVALVNNQTALTGACPTGSGIQDLVGYNTTASCAEGSPTAPLTNATAAIRNGNGCTDTGNNSTDFTVGPPSVRNSASSVVVCGGPCTDCNNNGSCDFAEIDANGGTGGSGGTLDCNSNGQLDSCELGTATDCDGNGVLDVCQINAAGGTGGSGGTLDCNSNGRLDSCDITTTPFLDSCNTNGQIDSCEPAGADCNTNTRLDCWDFKVGELTDVDGNSVYDACEGASVAEAAFAATVQAGCTDPGCATQLPPGIRALPNGGSGFNIEGEAYVVNNPPPGPPFSTDFRSYGGLRFPVGSVTAAFDTQFGAGNWRVTKAYLFLQQFNASFTVNGGLRIYWSNNDAQDLTVMSTINTATTYQNFATDFADREFVRDYAFVKGTGITIGSAEGNGTHESYLLYDLNGSNNTGMTNIGNELNSGAGDVTLLISPDQDPFVAATYAGTTSPNWRGPSLVVWAESTGVPGLCEYDINGDGNIDQGDVDCMISAVGGDPSCVRTDVAVDLDKNQDGNVDQGDVDIVVDVVGGGTAPGC